MRVPKSRNNACEHNLEAGSGSFHSTGGIGDSAEVKIRSDYETTRSAYLSHALVPIGTVNSEATTAPWR